MGEDKDKSLKVWCFYPGAHLGKAGKELKTGDYYFIDQYNQEFSRDIEPMSGGHTDNYYYQLMANVRKYKGMEKPTGAVPPLTINLNGDFSQWNKTQAVYYDHTGDIEHRNSAGQGQAGPYVNNTGRNDLVTMKAAYDNRNVYFYAETRTALSPFTDPSWMLLFIDADQNKETGWEGYDYVINARVTDAGNTTLISLAKDGSRGKTIPVPYKVKDNKLMVAIPRAAIQETSAVSLEFHWADNIQKMGDITEFFLNGDNAPERRANYVLEEGQGTGD
jgi:hypothetical protein